MKSYRLLILGTLSGFVSILMIACSTSSSSSGNTIPDWVQNPGSEFSEQQYLMAVGNGSTLNEARSTAFANLSQIFQMDINAIEEVNSEFIDRSVGSQFYSESTSQLLNNIKIGTNQELMNTSILATEVDNFGTYYALAGMDRSESSRIYREEISNNSIKINEYESQADSEIILLQKLILLNKAKALASANEILTRQLNIIQSGAGTGGEATTVLTRINEKFRTTQQQANIYIRSENATETIKASVSDIFQQSGFNIAGDQDNAILVVHVNYLTQSADLNRNDAEFVKWELVINVTDLQTDRSFKTYLAEGRDGAPSYADALKRADLNARNKIERDFNRFLTTQLFESN